MDIFLVDESEASLARLERLLEPIAGARVVGHAESAHAAIAGILQSKPDVVLLDLKLEHSSGFDVLNELHAHEPGIDVYMLSNYSSEPYRRHAQRLGAVDFFDKTTELERLRAALVARVAAGAAQPR